ncbi:helix-turn-helix domain-containing protein [Companilactobacillus insicii]|uniref:helix-turn-helix domain-containing protein n=1 Tax=Companilactobacillus insicii TaxID=1732567 RepID=UPI000F780D20|nr:helix-turn-helix transcriptional regulator [Companilactobacillus insicii]
MNRIKELRKENHWTQTKWERGYANPPINDFHTLAQIFKVSMEYLGGYSNERNRRDN